MTEVPRGLSARALVKALRADDFRLMRTRGSHHIFRHLDGRRVVVAYHRIGDTFPLGTLKAMIADIGCSEDDLRRLGLVKE
jgi:predicted RNA binding protein YcfA (HicA-like mRNA interferase family)